MEQPILQLQTSTHQKLPGIPIAVLHGQGPLDHTRLFLNSEGRRQTDDIKVEGNYKLALEPNNDPNSRDVIMVGGKSGSGKSHIARNFAIRYHELYPDRKIFLFSFLKEDKTIDTISSLIKRIKPELMEDENYAMPTIADFEKSLVIIDDVEGYERTSKLIFNGIQSVIDMIATMGRHSQSSIVVCSHLLSDYKRTRLFLGEAQQFVTFMHGVSQKQLYGLLGGYAGIDHTEIDALRKLPSRWICVRTQFPIVAIYEKGAHLVRQEKKTKKRTLLEVEQE
jgi:hypothetical protein